MISIIPSEEKASAMVDLVDDGNNARVRAKILTSARLIDSNDSLSIGWKSICDRIAADIRVLTINTESYNRNNIKQHLENRTKFFSVTSFSSEGK